jgi:flagellar protein FlbD
VITLTRSTGSVFALNSDLIERVEGTPETTITLIDGTTYHVREPLLEVVDRVRRYRGSVIAAASEPNADAAAVPDSPAHPPVPSLRPVDDSVVPFPPRGPKA